MVTPETLLERSLERELSRLKSRSYRSYIVGRISEKPTHMMIDNGMPTLRKSENL